jgi:hypothetical protein
MRSFPNKEITQVGDLMDEAVVSKVRTMDSEIAEANQYLLALNSIATLVSQSLSLDTVLNSALDKTLEIMNKTIGGILLLDEEKQELRYVAHRGLSVKYVREMHPG